MWLSEKAVVRENAGAGAKVGSVTIGGENAAVLLTGECRNLSVLSPQGVTWRPGAGTQVLVLETDDGEKFIVGAVDGGGTQGSLRLNGDVYITGRLFLNGVRVATQA